MPSNDYRVIWLAVGRRQQIVGWAKGADNMHGSLRLRERSAVSTIGRLSTFIAHYL
jgi:hypothetical protein